MKWCAALLMVGASFAHADVQLEFVNKTIPAYPVELSKAAITGSVRVGFLVHANGTVSDVNVIHNSDPAFANVALEAVRQWRFKPWAVSAENPPIIEVQNDLMFRLNDKRDWWDIYERAGLMVMSCKQFNEEVGLYRNDDPKRSLREMQTMLLAIRMTSQATEDGITSYQKSLARAEAFEEALPGIVQRCQTYPGLDFVDTWPASLRERLAQKD